MISKPKYLTQDLALILYLIKKAKIKKKRQNYNFLYVGSISFLRMAFIFV